MQRHENATRIINYPILVAHCFLSNRIKLCFSTVKSLFLHDIVILSVQRLTKIEISHLLGNICNARSLARVSIILRVGQELSLEARQSGVSRLGSTVEWCFESWPCAGLGSTVEWCFKS